MTKIKLVNEIIISASSVDLVGGVLRITTEEHTVEELAEMFSNKENTNFITLMTESGLESGIQTGFTSFIGVDYNAEGLKTVKLMQPADADELRISQAEGTANHAFAETVELGSTIDALLGMGVEVDG